MQLLIAGGSGFLGQELTRQALKQGHDVAILSRTPKEKARKQAEGFCGKSVVWCGSFDAIDAQIDKPVDVVINLTGANLFTMPWTAARKKVLWHSRVDKTAELVRWLLALKESGQPCPQVLLSGSAIGIYGDCGEKTVTETDASGDDWAAVLVRAWESAAGVAAAHGIRTVLLRTGLVMGNGGLLKPILPLFRLGLGGSLGTGSFWYSWIHAEDWARAVLMLMQDPDKNGAWNLVAPTPVRYKEFALTLGQVLRRPVWLTPPRWLLRILLGQRAALMLQSTRVEPARLQAAGFTWKYPTLRPALQAVTKKPNPAE